MWICLLLIAAIIIIITLSIKICLLKKSAKEICTSFSSKLQIETNTLIDISSHDPCMCELAACINKQLEALYKQRHLFQQGDRELKEAITNMSHDLRTPLTAICAYLDLLKTEEKSDLVKHYLDNIQNRTDALKQLTEELFCYTIAASDTEHLMFEPVIVNNVLEESISSYYALIKRNHISPTIEIPEQNVVCTLDKTALSRIFANILSNAVKYSDGDLDITLLKQGKIIFSNHASRLTSTQVARLFDRFYTVQTGRQSTGLGLSIAKVLVEQIHGSISATYEHGILTICIQFQN